MKNTKVMQQKKEGKSILGVRALALQTASRLTSPLAGAVVGQATPDVKIKSFPKAVVGNLPLTRPFMKKGKQPYFVQSAVDPRTLRAARPSGMTLNLMGAHITRRGFTRPSSPRSVSIRGIGAGRTGTALYPAYRPCGMTNAVRGFTLIELLVVVLIIGILAAVALPQYQKAVDKSRFVQVRTHFRAVYQAQQVFFLANGRYAKNWDELSADVPAPTSSGGTSNYAYWDWGYCYLQPKYGGCAYNASDGGSARLVQYWEDPIGFCQATASSERAKAICRAATGKNDAQAHCGDTNCSYYF